jgi:hypothetical protein
MQGAQLRAARASRDFATDEKHIRTEIAVMDKYNNGPVLLFHKIAACARTRFTSAHRRRSARTVSSPRQSATLQRRRRV